MQAEGVDEGMLGALGPQPGKGLDQRVQFPQLLEGNGLGDHFAGNQHPAGVIDIGLDIVGEGSRREFHSQRLQPAPVAHGFQQVGVALDLQPPHAAALQHRLERTDDIQFAPQGLLQCFSRLADGKIAEFELEPGPARLARCVREAGG